MPLYFALYLTALFIPWQEAMHSENIAALFMERLYGRPVAVAFTGLILWTSLACMFAITLGYSRIPYAAAKQGDFFAIFATLHPRGRFLERWRHHSSVVITDQVTKETTWRASGPTG